MICATTTVQEPKYKAYNAARQHHLFEQDGIYISSTITSPTEKIHLARATTNKDPEKKIVQQGLNW